MDELDLLKKDWKRSEHGYKQLNEGEIYQLLHRKSSSIVKWILIISVLELLFWSAFAFVGDTGRDKFKNGVIMQCIDGFSYFNYVVIAVFIVLFYRNYRRISATSATRELMQDILRTRKTVNYYIWYNLTVLVISLILGFILALSRLPEGNEIFNSGWATAAIIGLLLLAIIVLAGILWLFYQLIYGVLLRRLLANYRELKKMDTDE